MIKGKHLFSMEMMPINEYPIPPLIWNLFLLMGMSVYGSYSHLIHACKISGQIPFNSASLVVMIEATKLVVSLIVSVLWKHPLSELKKHKWKEFLPFGVPAILYCMNNNIAVHAQTQMDATTFQILCNLKIVFTTIMYRVVLRRPIKVVQWLSLHLLMLGGIFSSYGSFQDDADVHSSQLSYITTPGIFLILGYCFISGFAGVYTEKILKQQKLPLPLQNIVLYSYGVLCNGIAYIYSSGIQSDNIFLGYSKLTWFIIITQALNGLIMSAIIKYSNNLVRLFYIACGMLVTLVISIIVLDHPITPSLFMACFLTICALILYYR